MDPDAPGGKRAQILVTVSREYGSGGRVVGLAVAEKLGAEFVDSLLVDEVARRLQLPSEVVQSWDERREGVILRLLRAMQAAHPEYTSPLGTEVVAGGPDPDRVGVVVQEVIREEALSPRAVVVGRGASLVLAAHPRALHVRLVAPRADRNANIAERRGISAEEASREVERRDRERIDWVKHHFGADPRDPLHYAMVLNTGQLGYEGAVDVIVRAALAKAGA